MKVSDSLQSLLKLSGPLVVALLANAAMTFIDTLLMGQLGVDELAGGGLGAVIYGFAFLVGIGVLVPVSTTVAYVWGQNNPDAMHKKLLAGLVVALVLAMLFGTALWFCVPLLTWFELPPRAVIFTEIYLHAVVWTLWPALSFMVLRNFAMAVGKASAILRISVIAALSNYPVSYVLMTGWGGAPQLGLAGVGYGTALLSLFMFIAFSVDIYRKPLFKPFKYWQRWYLFSWQDAADLFRLGIPVGLALAMEAGMFSVAAVMAGILGAVQLAAHQVALQCVTLSFMVPLGISQAVSIMVGERFGKADYTGIIKLVRQAIATGIICSLFAASVFWGVPEFLVAIFIQDVPGTASGEVYQASIGLLAVAAVFQLVDGLQVISMGALRGLQFAMGPTIVTIVGYWGIGFPAAWLLMSFWSVQGVWAGMGMGLGATAMMLLVMLTIFLKRTAVKAVPRHVV